MSSSSSIANPTQLVEEFKKSGEFDRLRRELLKEFRQSDGLAAFLSRVEDIAKEKLASDSKLQYMPEAHVSREIMQELDRYPIVERAVSDVPLLSQPSFIAGMRESVKKILRENRAASGQPAGGMVKTKGTYPVPSKAGHAASTNAGQRPDGNADSDSDSSAESMDIEEYSSD